MNKNLVLIFFVTLIFNTLVQAETKSPHKKGIVSTVNLGFRYSSLLQHRGVVSYKDFQLEPGLTVFFFDDKVEFLGRSIGYRDFIFGGETVRFRTRLVSLTDKPFFPAHASIKDNFPHRNDTYEWNNRLEIFLPKYDDSYQAEIDISHSKDLKEHFGNYLDLSAKIKLFDFREGYFSNLIEPNLYASVGWGDSAHNVYTYGTGVGDGLNNMSYGLWVAFPERSDRFYPILMITRFETLGDFRNANLAKDNNEGWLISLIASVSLL